MSRSRRKIPIASMCAFSDKWFKVVSHRQERCAVRAAFDKDIEQPHPKSFGNPWNGPKDGKVWFGETWPKIYRK